MPTTRKAGCQSCAKFRLGSEEWFMSEERFSVACVSSLAAPFTLSVVCRVALAHRFFAPAMWCAERTLLALEIMENSGLGITRTLQITPGTDREAHPFNPHGLANGCPARRSDQFALIDAQPTESQQPKPHDGQDSYNSGRA